MDVVIIKYNAGNIQSVLFALERMGVKATVTNEAGPIMAADKVIFPGVGEASSAMKYLQAKKLDEVIVSLKQPVLGICLGMQLLCKFSEENTTDCLGIFNTNVRRFPAFSPGAVLGARFKVPQIGWNKVKQQSGEQYYYFVHSYYAELCAETTGTTGYAVNFSSMLQKDNFYGVQFHPEKSGDAGETILKNFLLL